MKLFRKLLNLFKIDTSVSILMLNRIWAIPRYSITLLLIQKYLSLEEQGFYYTFYSVLALSIFLELGISNVVLQFVSHEMAHLKWKGKVIVGDSKSKSRLASIFKLTIKWYALITVLGIVGITSLGYIFFNSTSNSQNVEWKGAWLFFAIAASSNIWSNSLLGFYSGCNKITEVVKVRFLANTFSSISQWTVLLLGFKLYAISFTALVQLVIFSLFILRNFKTSSIDLLKYPIEHDVSWKREVWPLQWKIALSWMSGYFIFQLFNPLLLKYDSAESAGKMGLTLMALLIISDFALSWINAKVPFIGQLVSLKKWDELNKVFSSLVIKVFITSVLGCLTFYVAVYFLLNLFPEFSERFLSLQQIVMLSLSIVIINPLLACWAIYLRAHKKEPYLWTSILFGLLNAIICFYLVKLYGTWGIITTHLALNIIISLVIGRIIFVRKRNLWHSTT